MKKYRKPSILPFKSYLASSGAHGKFRRGIFSENPYGKHHKGWSQYSRTSHSSSALDSFINALKIRRKRYGR